MNTRFAAGKAIACAVVLALALAGCGPVTTDAEDAAEACSGVRNLNIRDTCMSNYVSTKQAGIDAQWSAIGAGMLSRPVHSSCMNIGGIITCN